ncbi:hypothetical protein NCS57_00431800 [Fusarium keratoplasticum]|uniref:Uncharacterized protein n=1 Tax=Fusarium keratoplasticum TaxID=1328300 RepID=A0ACC0R5Y4_9HYPO|nr:hypothetical protein NCS57_00431800 [Fusarium keratoplasticum]KAI8675309.1 hypothetical protein NCS57_00431800 [Fusarium keratoplasticum]
MESPPKASSQQGDADDEEINAVKRLLDDTETTPGKVTALLNLQESTSEPESDQDEDGSSDEDDPWLNAGAQPGVPANREHGISEAEVSNGHAAEYYQERNTHDPNSWEYALALAEQDDAVGHTAHAPIFLGICANLATQALRRELEGSRGLGDGVFDVQPPKQQPMTPNHFELYLKKTLFEESVNISTTVDEPGWADDPDSSVDTVVFPGWNDPAEEFKLKPQGKFVAETKKALDDFLEHVQLGGNLSALGNGGGFSSTGLPSLLKKSFTTYEWLGMWRSSKGRKIRISRSALGDGCSKERPTTPGKKEDKLEDLSEHEQERLLSLENELLGLDKYMGGDSEYLTVVTYSDDYVGAIALFQAKLSPDHKITTLDRIAMISDVPRKICDILQDEIKPNRYVVGRAKRKVKCFDSGEMPPLQIIKVSNQATPWSSSGGGWRQALRVPEQTTEYSSGEGLIATIPQMIGLLHLQHQTLTKLASSQAFVFEKSIDASGGLLRRGILLKGRPEGLSHIGQNTRIAVLFPMDSVWAREQFFWA